MQDGTELKFEEHNGVIYHICVYSNCSQRIGKSSLVVPPECRAVILSVAHESPLAEHFTYCKTEMRVKDHFYWPNMGSDLRDYCKSCDKCQRMSAKGQVKPVPLKQMPILTEPFSHVSMI